jgi:ubiquinone/menaquinone biosynthesis C-methylase UbiE
MKNIKERKTIIDFGNQWLKFKQNYNQKSDLKQIFNNYFKIFPKKKFLNKKKIGVDIGCGSGRWASFIAKRVKFLYLIDASSKAVAVAKETMKNQENTKVLNKNIYNLKLKKNFFDFAYCLGVLHHVKNIDLTLKNINHILKKNGVFLLYLYYSFENRSITYKFIWRLSNLLRILISNLPFLFKQFICDVIAFTIYFPISRLSKYISKLGMNFHYIPLYYYKDFSIYTLRTDSLDRFGSKIENRFSKTDIKKILIKTGFKDIKFSSSEPYWCVVCYKK